MNLAIFMKIIFMYKYTPPYRTIYAQIVTVEIVIGLVLIPIAYGNTELCKTYVVTIYFRTIINILIPANNNSNNF